MINVYYGPNINNVIWQVTIDNITTNLYFWPKNTSIIEIFEKICQHCLFTTYASSNSINVIDISNWKLNTNETKNIITDLYHTQQDIIFILENKSCYASIFNELKIKLNYVKWVNQLDKNKLIHLMLAKNQINLDNECKNMLDYYLPYNVQHIENEISKLALLQKEKITIDDLNNIVFFEIETNIFCMIDYWLNNDKNKTIYIFNHLLKSKYKISDIIPIITYTLLQLKFYCESIQENWNMKKILDKLNIPFWFQNKFAYLTNDNKKITKIDNMLNCLYNFDVSVKMEKNLPYSHFIRLLLN